MLFYVTEGKLTPVTSPDDIINHEEVLNKITKARAIEKLDEIIETVNSISSTLEKIGV